MHLIAALEMISLFNLRFWDLWALVCSKSSQWTLMLLLWYGSHYRSFMSITIDSIWATEILLLSGIRQRIFPSSVAPPARYYIEIGIIPWVNSAQSQALSWVGMSHCSLDAPSLHPLLLDRFMPGILVSELCIVLIWFYIIFFSISWSHWSLSRLLTWWCGTC